AQRREPTAESAGMNRLYVVESTPTLTGSMADHRLPMPAHRIAAFAHALASALGMKGTPRADSALTSEHGRWIAALARDLQKNQGTSLVIAGESQPPIVHALVHAINQTLGNVGQSVIYTAPVEAQPVNQVGSLHELVNDMDAGRVDVLVI